MTFDQEVQAIEQAMELDMAEEERSAHESGSVENPKQAWKLARRALPSNIARLIETIDVPSLRVEAVERIEADLFGWSERRDGSHGLDLAAVKSAWQRSASGNCKNVTLRMVRRVVDDVKRMAQLYKLQEHEVATGLPPWQRNPEIRDSVLYTRDVTRGTVTFGVRSYLECTPIEVVVVAVHRWMAATQRQKPRCWDLTAGSGTVGDLITSVFGGTVVSTDIALESAHVCFGDLRDAGHHGRHTRKVAPLPGYRFPREVVTSPDLVFLHPPSLGWPSCLWLYGERSRLEAQRAAQLDICCLLDIDRYVETIASAVRRSLERLAPGGLLSLLVPAYVRINQEIEAEAGIADEVLDQLAGDSVLVERHGVVDQAPVQQASLGRTRGPVEHLIFSKKAAP